METEVGYFRVHATENHENWKNGRLIAGTDRKPSRKTEDLPPVAGSPFLAVCERQPFTVRCVVSEKKPPESNLVRR